MTIAQLIPMAINLSMGLMVFALGLQASWRDAAYMLRQPGLFASSLLSMNVIMVMLAIEMDALFALNPAVKLALVAFDELSRVRIEGTVGPGPCHQRQGRHGVTR